MSAPLITTVSHNCPSFIDLSAEFVISAVPLLPITACDLENDRFSAPESTVVFIRQAWEQSETRRSMVAATGGLDRRTWLRNRMSLSRARQCCDDQITRVVGLGYDFTEEKNVH